ncbi:MULTISPECIES: exodeoxyribonuclease VII large subunit [unclassified Moorena]|uniref:exodeoxyribonuclease VII large subunit n=1 Tax=unclassified Moorena TaxID=2683338 RepID=UPI0013BA749A|nr:MULTISPECIES: exodeoxyribonuclease VII large subunit [unclassified Moorena]NEQ15746.1 exodeoxyribonuclease VII large subunit [Moorena sp. SIO3E2]NER88051.1 exodeoxyribonuclease VII large subunit [Moorena sp. SIO3A2]NES40192.1 exodeoxyribonuclease VII large subunit [Moorena sp. SIO2C4]
MASSTINSLFSEAIVSVAGLTDYIQELLEEDDQLHRVWVIGEVSSSNHHPKGMFFTLQDGDAKATIRCVAWRSQLSKLVQLPVIGEQLIILGSLRVYPQRGQYQLNVWQALPAGEGLQALRSRQLRQRFEAEGLFDPLRKRPLPIHPETIAVVTSPQAAAWGDIKRTLQQRYPGLRVLLSPAQVQGELATTSIVNAIDRVERDGRAKLLILARGGGASEDLACFNDERVVRAIAQCSIPVITGIGHQRDESLADLVADYSAHTPTAAAEQAVPELITLYAEHQQRQTSLYQAVTQITQASRHQLHHLRTRLRHLALDQQLHQEQNAIAFQHQRLLQVTSKRLSQGIQHCQLLKEKLNTLDPQKVLQRGYALVRTSDGTIASSTGHLAPGEELQIQLGEGQVKVKIIDIVDS